MAKRGSPAKKTTLVSKEGSNFFSGLVPRIIVVAFIAVIAIFAIFTLKQGKSDLEFQKGAAYVTWSEDGYLNPTSDESLDKLRDSGVEWITVLVTWYQKNTLSNEISRRSTTPSDEALLHVIRKAHENGLKVMLKPHLDLIDKSDGSWRGEIMSLKEEGWVKWFKSYTDFIMYYLKIAREEKVEIFCVGTELSTTVNAKWASWKTLIEKVRSNYSGMLTYAAHWDNFHDIRFWHLLDYVGINAYFPLTEEEKPTFQEIKQGLVKWLEEMEEFQKRVNKPIIFPEYGCNSADGAAIHPWEHSSRREVNLKLQSDYYRAYYETFWEKEWFYGFYCWYWGTNIRMGGKFNRGFTPQNKPAEEVLKKWYSKRVSRKTTMEIETE